MGVFIQMLPVVFQQTFFAGWKLWHSTVSKVGSCQTSSYLDRCRVGEGAARDAFVGNLLYHKHNATGIIEIILFISSNKSSGQILLFSSNRLTNRGSKRLSNLPKITYL